MKKTVIILFTLFFGLLMLIVTSCVEDFGFDSTDDTSDDIEVSDEGSEDTVSDQESDNALIHESDADYVWSEGDVLEVALNGSSVSTSASGVTVSGSKITITSAGTYKFSGSLSDGRIIVNTGDEEIVRLILSGVNIACSSSAPIYGENSEKIMIVLADGTENYLTDASSYSFDSDDDEPNAAIFSKDDLTVYGEGSLSIDANYNDAIASKDGLIIASGTIDIESVDDGIRGKDYLIIKKGNITVEADGDGLKSDNEDDETKGYIYITDGSFNITTGGDAITAQTDVLISDGEFTIKSGNGSSGSYYSTESMKGIKAATSIVIDYAIATITSSDDAIHSNGSISINGGIFEIATGDDGIHADNVVGINGGDYDITKSYEGIESAIIKINAGNIHLVASDDGLNVAGGNDNSGMRWPGQGVYSSSSSSYYMLINGGYIYVDADGDGLDANGSIEMTGGTVIVNGPTSNGNGTLDYDGLFKISGGTLVGAGSSGMVQAPGTSSSQYSVLVVFSSTLSADKLVHIETSNGDNVVTFSPTKSYKSFVYSSPELEKGASYNVYYGGSSTGTVVDGIYSNGSYTSGTSYKSFSISSVVTTIGSFR